MIRLVNKEGTQGILDRHQHAYVVQVYTKPSQTHEFATAEECERWLGEHGFRYESSSFRTAPSNPPNSPLVRPGPILSPAGPEEDQQAADGAAIFHNNA